MSSFFRSIGTDSSPQNLIFQKFEDYPHNALKLKIAIPNDVQLQNEMNYVCIPRFLGSFNPFFNSYKANNTPIFPIISNRDKSTNKPYFTSLKLGLCPLQSKA